jgi:hypothetical protein
MVDQGVAGDLKQLGGEPVFVLKGMKARMDLDKDLLEDVLCLIRIVEAFADETQ